MRVHASLQVTWLIANTEAGLAASSLIEPVHFLVAALSVIDGLFHGMGLSDDIINAVQPVARECRAFFRMSDDDLTKARRGLRQMLHRQSGLAPTRYIGRSEASRQLFRDAESRAEEAGSAEVSLAHLLVVVLEQLPGEAVPVLSPALLNVPNPVHPRAAQDIPALGEPSQAGQAKPKTPLVDLLGRDLTALARSGRLTPVVGRRAEMRSLARYLSRTSKRNVILVGEAGVGKTAIVEGLAQEVASAGPHSVLGSWRVVQINVADLIASASRLGDLEARVRQLIAEVTADPDFVLFIDEIHLAVKGGAAGGSPLDVANLLKAALARADFRCIGATTTEEYERHIKTDPAFGRRFQVIRVTEPTKDEALLMCREWARRIEKIQDVVFADDAVTAAVDLSVQLIPKLFLPDKAIDLLENAAVHAKLPSLSPEEQLPSKELPRIERRHIEDVLEEQHGIAVTGSELLDVGRLGAALRTELVGQDLAINDLLRVVSSLERRSPGTARPLGILLFAGPSGVGKTFAAEIMGQVLFGANRSACARFSMNEFKERHELARLIGAPPGFIGHEQAGALFRFAEANPQGLILLDEMEKAHPEVQDYFLQIFDKAEAVDSRGRRADFRRHFFIMTCNVLGGQYRAHGIGFGASEGSGPSAQAEMLNAQLRSHFRSEFISRIDGIVLFSPLGPEGYEILVARHVAALERELAQQHGALLVVSDEGRLGLLTRCSDQKDGARGFAKLFERVMAAPLLEYARGEPSATRIRVGWSEGEPIFSRDAEGG